MTILAILQNQWFKPESLRTIERIYREHGGTPEDRAKLNARFLFYKSLTGKRLRCAFGEELCEQIIWEEASAKIGVESSAKFRADPNHIADLIQHFKPAVVLAFGNVAIDGVLAAWPIIAYRGFSCSYDFISGPHPAARHATVITQLAEMATKVRRVEQCA